MRIDGVDKDKLLDLLDETKKKHNIETRKLGMNQLHHYILNKWRNIKPDRLYNFDEDTDDVLCSIVKTIVDTYRDPDYQQHKLLDGLVDSYENKVMNGKYKCEQLTNTIKILIGKLNEFDTEEFD